jgi:hypothetical protein
MSLPAALRRVAIAVAAAAVLMSSFPAPPEAAVALELRPGAPSVAVASERHPGAPSVALARALEPAVPTLPPLGSDGHKRKVARVDGEHSVPADFVAGELIVSAAGKAAFGRVADRWRGKVVKVVKPRAAGLDVDPIALIRIDASRADVGALPKRLQALQERPTGELRVSSRAGLRLLAAAAEEAKRGTHVGVNYLTQPDGFEDRTTTEAPAFPGFKTNAFDWLYMGAAFPSLGAAEAWRTLSIGGKLANKVDMAIIDGGFQPNADFPPGTTALSVYPGLDPIGTPNAFQPSKPWHGTNVAEIAAAVPDNAFGVAGAAGPVARLHLVYTTGDMFMGIAAVSAAVADGARILNMSYGAAIPATLSFTVGPFSAVTGAAAQTGHLLFASAGNDGEDVDAEDCFLICWEEEFYAPCENAGVICVGGLSGGSDWRHEKSNWGREWCESKYCDVEIFGPYRVWKGPDPDAPANTARLGFGTSYSSPYVAGVAALIWAANPGLSAKQVRDILFGTAAGSPDGTVPRVVNAAPAVKAALGGSNIAPKVKISAPANGSSVPYGGFNVAQFKATAFDVEPGCCTITWSSNKDGFLGSGASIQAVLGKPGVHTITATAKDAGGAIGTAKVTIMATNQPPKAKITEPADPSPNIVRYVPYTFSGIGTDSNQAGNLPCGALKWTSSNPSDASFPATGCHVPATFTTKGPRTITLTVADQQGATGKATTFVVVLFDPPLHSPPIVNITNPHDGDHLDPDNSITLAATAFDPDGSRTLMTYQWSVTYGGVTKLLGTSKQLSWRPGADVPFHCGGRQATLTFKATDADGTGTDSAPVYVDYPPC